VSGATARLLPPGTPLREVGRIVVKGRSEPVDVFTFDEDEDVRAGTAEALADFRRQDWDAAEAAFRRVLDRRVGDTVVAHYLQRIEALRRDPPGPGWDGSESLEKL
jgi:adenylate cyclase